MARYLTVMARYLTVMPMIQRTFNDLQQYNGNENFKMDFFTENAQPSSIFGPAWKGLRTKIQHQNAIL